MENCCKRILQLGKFYPIGGGVEKVMYELTTGLSARGVDCDMLAASCHSHGLVTQLNPHATLTACRTWLKAAATTIAPSMITRLRKICNQYDIIHIHHPDPMACLALRLSGYRGKVILHWHSDIQKQKMLLQAYLPLQNWLLRRADLILGTSPTYLKESPHLAKFQHKMQVLPIGVDPIPDDPQGARRIQAQYPGKQLIFSLGRLVAYKGYRYLIEAARYLPDNYMVLIGGKGPLQAELTELIQRYRLEERVKLLGRVSDADLPAYYHACRLFCLSSVFKTEAFGIVQIEAMSCGKPLVATTIPQSGVAWVNAHGVSGLNVPPADAQALANAIRQITESDDTYKAFAQRSRQRYENTFTKQQMISQAIHIYNQL